MSRLCGSGPLVTSDPAQPNRDWAVDLDGRLARVRRRVADQREQTRQVRRRSRETSARSNEALQWWRAVRGTLATMDQQTGRIDTGPGRAPATGQATTGRTLRQPGGPVELVVLLDEQGRVIGSAPKATVHTAATPLHRAFSCYLFGPDGRLLVTRRAAGKRTFPGVWTNSVCGHPAPGEVDPAAIARRTGQELRLTAEQVTVALPAFRYRAASDGVVENEICPVYLAQVDGDPDPDPAEVQDWAWTPWDAFRQQVLAEPGRFSPWSRLQADQLHAAGAVPDYLRRRG